MPNINKNIIMQAGAAVANATNKAAGLSASTPEPGSIISAIQLVNGGRTIGPDALAHFTESVRNKLLSLLVSMEPIQDFNGYGHPWPAGGGKNKYLIKNSTSTAGSGLTVECDGNATIKFSGTANTGTWYQSYIDGGSFTLPAGTYTLSVHLTGTVPIPENGSTIFIGCTNHYINVSAANPDVSTTFTLNEDTAVNASGWTCAGEYNATVKVQVERSSTATSWAPYSNICPITGRTGANAYVSPTPTSADATTYTADWTTPAGTVYAGSADIVTGDIKAAPYYASYNGETLVGPWVSSMDEYDPEGTPTTGAQVVDLGGTMTEYHITGQDIITLVGYNYIWSDSGDVTITE